MKIEHWELVNNHFKLNQILPVPKSMFFHACDSILINDLFVGRDTKGRGFRIYSTKIFYKEHGGKVIPLTIFSI